jgi:hypothetical protein
VMTACLLAPVDAPGQQRLVVPRLADAVQLDGRSDEPSWQAIEPLPVVASAPVFGAAPSEHTEFRVAYDDQYLWFAGRMYDSDPTGIRATSLRRDDGSFSNDWFAVNLDTFLDRETSLVFGVNGSRSPARAGASALPATLAACARSPRTSRTTCCHTCPHGNGVLSVGRAARRTVLPTHRPQSSCSAGRCQPARSPCHIDSECSTGGPIRLEVRSRSNGMQLSRPSCRARG